MEYLYDTSNLFYCVNFVNRVMGCGTTLNSELESVMIKLTKNKETPKNFFKTWFWFHSSHYYPSEHQTFRTTKSLYRSSSLISGRSFLVTSFLLNTGVRSVWVR